MHPLSAAQRLVAYWAALGSRLPPGATEEDLRAFEEHHHVSLPADFRAYLGLCNGLTTGQAGNFPHDWLGLIEFWPLDVISAKHEGVASAYFGFADFLIDSHWYVIRLSRIASRVILTGSRRCLTRQLTARRMPMWSHDTSPRECSVGG